VPERLGDLVRGLIGEHPDIDVHADLRAIEAAPEGAVMVLIPRPEDADALNLGRPVFAHKKLKVVLWCDHETTVALAQEAPDFYDWISEHHDCPPGAVPHAVAGFRAAYKAGAPGIVWRGPGDEADIERLWKAFSEAFPGETLTWIDPRRDYEELLAAVRGAGEGWIACRARAFSNVRRFRWAMAEVGRRGRAIIAGGTLPCPGWWPVHGQMMDFAEARRALEEATCPRSGGLAALTGLEPEAVALVGEFVRNGAAPAELVQWLSQGTDPGAALLRESAARGRLAHFEFEEGSYARPAVWRAVNLEGIRHLGVDSALHRTLDGVEARLLARPDSKALAKLAEDALNAGEQDVAEVWVLRVIHTGSPEAQLVWDVANTIESSRTSGDRIAEIRAALATDGRFVLRAGWRLFHAAKTALQGIVGFLAVGLETTAGLEPYRALLRSGQYKDISHRLNGMIRSLPYDQVHQMFYEFPIFRQALTLLADALAEQGDYSSCVSCVESAIILEGRTVGVESPLFYALASTLGMAFSHIGQGAEAESLLRKLLGTGTLMPASGKSSTETSLAAITAPEAAEYLHLFLALPKSPALSKEDRARTLRRLAEALIAQGRYDEAEHLLENATREPLPSLTPDHPERWRTPTTLGRVFALQGHPDQAEPVLCRALALAEQHAGARHPDIARILAELARVEHRLGRPQAPTTARRALDLYATAQLAEAEKTLVRGELSPIAGSTNA